MKYNGTIPFLAGVVMMLCGGWLLYPRVLYQSYPQPVQFSHKVHAGDKVGLKCEDCHTVREDGGFTGVPALEKCSGCHVQPVTSSAQEKLFIDQYVTPNREIPWRIYSRQPANVWFSHAHHVKLAKLACERCHRDHGKTDTLRPLEQNRISGYSRDIWGPSMARVALKPGESMKMNDCARCHEEHGVENSCLACHK